MKILFEKWVENNDMPDISHSLFSEAILCYKMSAYRSAYITSYIAFQHILKDRIINGICPNGINQNLWSTICSKLLDDDYWDTEVCECVKRQSPNRIFCINSSIVSEYEALRVIRNKCAHGKFGKIEYFHVENLWNFIMENFYTFVMNGGVNGIVNAIKDHYDRTITPPGKDLTYIIDSIKIGIPDSDLNNFISEVYNLSETNNKVWFSDFTDSMPMIDLWDKLMYESNQRIHDSIISFIINSKSDKICSFITRYPNTADEFLSDAGFARKLWTGLMFSSYHANDGFWVLLKKIIENNMVPQEEMKEFDKDLFKSLGLSFKRDQINLLSKTGYFTLLRNELFDYEQYQPPNGITYANTNSFHFYQYINCFGLDEKSVSIINNIFSFATYGDFFNMICKLMANDEILNEYKKIVREKGISDYSEKFKTELSDP